MKSLKNKNTNKIADQVAALLASHIVATQIHLSTSLNQWFNAFSVRQQKNIAIMAGLLTSIILIICSFSSFYGVPKLSQHPPTVHIGRPSDLTKSPVTRSQLTDSLIQKSKS